MCCFGFFLKKLFSAFLLPLPFSLAIIFLGLIFLWFTKKQKVGKILVTIGAVLLLFMGTRIATVLIISPLDHAYSVYKIDKNNPVKFIVVLSGGAGFTSGVPMNTNSDHVTLSRIMEGIRIYKSIPGSKIVLTGGPVSSTIPFSVIESYLLVQLGIPKEDIILDTKSLDTTQEVLNVRKIVKDEPFVLVTSAVHMTRAVKLFQKQGMSPISAPTDFYVSGRSYIIPIPSASSLHSIDAAIHEYIGIFWAKMHGKL